MSRKRRSRKPKAEIAKNAPCHCGSGKKFKHCHGDPNRSFAVEPQNRPEVVDYHLTSSDGERWTKKPGRIMAMISGKKPEDTDEIIESMVGKFFQSADVEAEKAFSERIRDLRHKLYAIRYHLLTLKEEIKIRTEEFEKEYSAGSGVSFEIQNPRLIFEVEAFLFQVKSSLDIFVQALGRIIPPLKSMRTFRKKKIDGKERAGGSVIVALTDNGFEELGSLFEAHRTEWIQELVSMRDTITHYSNLKGFHCFIEDPYLGGDEVVIHYPTMPSGELVDEYCQYIFDRLLDLYEEAHSLVFKDDV